jgi:hypothetical protein
MALSEIELKRCERDIARFMERRRPPPHVRSQVDLQSRILGQSVEILDVRPDWTGAPGLMDRPVARATFVRARNVWRIFWMRQDLKWHGYEPHPEASSLEEVLDVVDRDEHCCFFG